MKIIAVSCGLAQLKALRKSSLNQLSQHHNLLPRNSPHCWLNTALLHLLLMRKDGSSPSCSVIWSIPPDSPASSIPKSTGKSSVRISECVPKSSSATMGISPNCSVTVFLSTLGIPRHTKMTHSERYVLG